MVNYTLGIIGISGKFGSRIFSLAQKEKEILSVLGSTRTQTTESSISTSTKDLFESCDVIIDVSSWKSMQEHIDLALFYKKPLVIGTTGHPFDIEILLQNAAPYIPIFYASNFSVAVLLLSQVIKKISDSLPTKKIEIQETHHESKKDKPSGTALFLAKQIDSSQTVTTISHRIDKVAFEHQTSFMYEDEEIIVTHKAFSRDPFAKGALLASHFLLEKAPGAYFMEDLLLWLASKPRESLSLTSFS